MAAAGGRQIPRLPGPIRRDCPLRANKQMVFTAFTLAGIYELYGEVGFKVEHAAYLKMLR